MRMLLIVCAIIVLGFGTLPTAANTIVQLHSPTQFNYPVTTIDFDDGPHKTVANTRYLSQGVEFSRDDGYEIVLYDQSGSGQATTSLPNTLSTTKYPAPTWVMHLNVDFSYPIFELGAFFGNDEPDWGFKKITLSAFDENGSVLGSVSMYSNRNDIVDQFIGLRSDVPVSSARFSQDGKWCAVSIDDLTFRNCA